MKGIKFVMISGVILIGLGLFLLVGWYTDIQRFPTLLGHGDVIISLAPCFVLFGAGFLTFGLYARTHTRVSSEEQDQRLMHMAYHDPLTGLANRNKLEHDLKNIISLSARRHHGFALLILDLDHFKNINDTIGHDAGDALLRVVAERIKNNVRTSDVVARMGGDEFVLIMMDMESAEAIAQVAQKIINGLLNPIIIKNQELYITTSMGISFYPHDGTDLETLMRNADLALYRAKEQGRNNYQFCTPEMTAKAQDKMLRQNALAQALARNEFFLHYQPKMDVASHKLTGVETFLRWESKDYGKVNAAEIIALAEETGLIIPISEWILRTACTQLKAWQGDYHTSLTLAVNLSSKQFKQPTFAEGTLRILRELDFKPENLEVEITESVIMQDPEGVLFSLQKLRQQGVQIAIDDFGTGYSSLSYLKRFAIDKIKIDKTFIQQLISDVASASLVSAMIAMANKLNIKTVAEGVETKEQFQFLLHECCSEIQGYYLTEPLSAKGMGIFLKDYTSVANYIKSQINKSEPL
jgi:diguanylate cyclase (GGDEF)-like protein